MMRRQPSQARQKVLLQPLISSAADAKEREQQHMQDVTAQVDELCSALGHSLPREVVLQSLQGADFDSERALLALFELLPAVASHDTDSDALAATDSEQIDDRYHHHHIKRSSCSSQDSQSSSTTSCDSLVTADGGEPSFGISDPTVCARSWWPVAQDWIRSAAVPGPSHVRPDVLQSQDQMRAEPTVLSIGSPARVPRSAANATPDTGAAILPVGTAIPLGGAGSKMGSGSETGTEAVDPRIDVLIATFNDLPEVTVRRVQQTCGENFELACELLEEASITSPQRKQRSWASVASVPSNVALKVTGACGAHGPCTSALPQSSTADNVAGSTRDASCDASTSAKVELVSSNVSCTAIFLQASSSERLLRTVPAMHAVEHGDHVLLQLRPTSEQLHSLLDVFGREVHFEVVAEASNDRAQAVAVALLLAQDDPNDHDSTFQLGQLQAACADTVLHVAISTANGVPTSYVSTLLASPTVDLRPVQPLVLHGIVGAKCCSRQAAGGQRLLSRQAVLDQCNRDAFNATRCARSRGRSAAAQMEQELKRMQGRRLRPALPHTRAVATTVSTGKAVSVEASATAAPAADTRFLAHCRSRCATALNQCNALSRRAHEASSRFTTSQGRWHLGGEVAASLANRAQKQLASWRRTQCEAAHELFDHVKTEFVSSGVIDLHGLTVSEAVHVLDAAIDTAVHERMRTFTVVTGRGRHSAGGRARILPAVKTALSGRNIPFSEPHVGGLVRVRLLDNT